MPAITAAPTTCQLSGKDPEGRPILSTLAKRTYRLLPDGRCTGDVDQAPLTQEFEDDPESGRLVRDTDLFPYKPATDVVVRGHVHAPGGRPRARFEAAVWVGGRAKKLAVVGDRFCIMVGGEVRFSEPIPVDKVPLTYNYAYGGRDAEAEEKYGNPYRALQPYFAGTAINTDQASPYLYPRNPYGCGYLTELSPGAMDRLVLPNLEDPLDPLTPERLAAGAPGNWPVMPLPCCTDWMDYACFPRAAFCGVLPSTDPQTKPLAEVARGYAPADILDDEQEGYEKVSLRLTNGASLGLQFPHFRGGEVVTLDNMHAKHPRFAVRLPAERPKVWVDGRKGTLKETDPVIHTVVIEPDEGRVTVVWRGSAVALRPYMPEELAKMPFKVEWP